MMLMLFPQATVTVTKPAGPEEPKAGLSLSAAVTVDSPDTSIIRRAGPSLSTTRSQLQVRVAESVTV